MPNLDSPRDVIYVVADLWYGVKTQLEIVAGLDDGLLHICVGVILQALFAAVVRTPLRTIWPWLAVFCAELGNEGFDLFFSALSGDDSVPASMVDIALTMALPTLIMLHRRKAWVNAAAQLPDIGPSRSVV